jgi:hypothetical protein
VVASVRRHDPQVELVVEYHADGQVWTHSFDRWPVTDLDGDLARVGFAFEQWLIRTGRGSPPDR